MADEIEVIDTDPVPAPITLEASAFELAQRQAQALAQSDLVPDTFKGNVPNCMIALELAHRTGASSFAIMQNLFVIHGRPSWSSQYIIAGLNSCGRFSPLRFELSDEGTPALACYAWAIEKATGDRIEGPIITAKMAEAEGWISKKGSKWKTMPELMIRYRAASAFGKLYAPEQLLGMNSAEEEQDIGPGISEHARPERPASEALSDLRDVTPPKAEPEPADKPEQSACETCKGSGTDPDADEPCRACGGSGWGLI